MLLLLNFLELAAKAVLLISKVIDLVYKLVYCLADVHHVCSILLVEGIVLELDDSLAHLTHLLLVLITMAVEHLLDLTVFDLEPLDIVHNRSLL